MNATVSTRTPHPHAVPTLEPDDASAIGELSDIDPELRYRMISEAAYHRYLARDCVDGYDIEDWLTAEADVDRELQNAVPPR